MKSEAKSTAIGLRKNGFSYSQIRRNIQVSKSTLSLWLRDVELDYGEAEKLLKGREISRDRASKAKKLDRVNRTNVLVESGRKEVISLIDNPLFFAGLMLYWAEGAKNSSEQVKFTNSDESMIILIMKWFRESCKVPEGKFRLHLHIHNMHHRPDAEGYWSKLTGIPKNQFYKTFVKQSTLRHRRNVLYNGTCAVVVNDRAFFRRITGWKLGLLDYFKITPRSSMDRTTPF